VFLMLAGFYGAIEIVGFWHWSFPLLVLGANSIVAYCCANFLLRNFIADTWRVHLGRGTFQTLGPEWESMLTGTAVLLTLWLVLFWMYRNKIFVRI
jgi:predicted acyltransferase